MIRDLVRDGDSGFSLKKQKNNGGGWGAHGSELVKKKNKKNKKQVHYLGPATTGLDSRDIQAQGR